MYTLLNPEAFPRKFVDQVETRAKGEEKPFSFALVPTCLVLRQCWTLKTIPNLAAGLRLGRIRECVPWEVGVGGRELCWESSLTPVLNFWSSPCAARDRGSVASGRWGWGERSYFGRVVWLQCQTSDQVPVLQEIMKVVMDTQRMLVNLSGWLKTVKGNVAFVKVWKYIVIHLLLASRGLISHSGRVAFLSDVRQPEVRHFLLLNALTLPNWIAKCLYSYRDDLLKNYVQNRRSRLQTVHFRWTCVAPKRRCLNSLIRIIHWQWG